MKRDDGLRALSDDHHQGLVLALKAKKAAAGEPGFDPDTIWHEVLSRFAAELEPHFQIEERHLAPPLRQHGETALLQRLDDEHAQLRSLVASTERTTAELGRFGELLQQHIRFEERELFERAQQLLSGQQLTAIAEACAKR